jgi:hypothetical protein
MVERSLCMREVLGSMPQAVHVKSRVLIRDFDVFARFVALGLRDRRHNEFETTRTCRVCVFVLQLSCIEITEPWVRDLP